MLFCGYSTGLYHISSFLILNEFKPARIRDGAHIDIPINHPFFPISISSFVMPRLIILHPPGSYSGVKHRRYSAREKIAILAKICRIKRETNVFYRQAAVPVGISHTLVICWHVVVCCKSKMKQPGPGGTGF
jgi:hypothetical protein